MAIAFLLLTLVTQASFLVVARNAAQAAADQATRSAARADADPTSVENELVAALERTVPGGENPMASVEVSDRTVTTSARVDWTPPGPRWATITIQIQSKASLSLAP